MNDEAIIPGIERFLERLNGGEQSELIRQLAWDINFGCWTRPGLELIAWPVIRERARWVMYADLDCLHQANAKFGEDEVDRRFRKAMRLRTDDVGAIGRWKYGDELLVVLCDYDDRPPTDPVGVAARLQKALNEVELSATFGIASVYSYDLAENVEAAYMRVRRAKKSGQRGSINQTGRLAWRWGS